MRGTAPACPCSAPLYEEVAPGGPLSDPLLSVCEAGHDVHVTSCHIHWPPHNLRQGMHEFMHGAMAGCRALEWGAGQLGACRFYSVLVLQHVRFRTARALPLLPTQMTKLK